MARSRISRARGFTLLELMVASAIFSLLMALCAGSLRGILSAGERSNQSLEEQVEFDRAWFLIEDDLINVRDRPITQSFGSEEPSIVCSEHGDLTLAVTRSGQAIVVPEDRVAKYSALTRVAYRKGAEGKLFRDQWAYIDRTDDTPRSVVILEGVVSFVCDAILSEPDLQNNQEILGVLLTLELQNGARYPRTFALKMP